MDDWDVPRAERRQLVQDLIKIAHQGESERGRLRAIESCIRLGIDKPLENIDRERDYDRLQVERAKLKLLRDGGNDGDLAALLADDHADDQAGREESPQPLPGQSPPVQPSLPEPE
jgi:hypothetical protein